MTIEAILLAAVVPFMTPHKNIRPANEVSTNFYGSVTGIVTKTYVEDLGIKGGGSGNVESVNGKTGIVVIAASDLSAVTYSQSTNIANNAVATGVADWAKAGKAEPQGMTTNAVRDIASSASVTNAGAVAQAAADADEKYLPLSGGTVGSLKILDTSYSSLKIGDTSAETGNSIHEFTIDENGYFYLKYLGGEMWTFYLNTGTEEQGQKCGYGAQILTDLSLTTDNAALVAVITNASPKADFSTNNLALVSTITNTIDGEVLAMVADAANTNAVAVLNETIGKDWQTYGGGLGGLLAAILAAIAWLKNKKVDTSTIGDEWDKDATYAKGSNAVYNGKFYTSKADDNKNHKPTETDWWDVSNLFSNMNTSLADTISQLSHYDLAANAVASEQIVSLDQTSQYATVSAAFTLKVPSADVTVDTTKKAEDLVVYINNTNSSSVAMTLDPTVEWHYDGNKTDDGVAATITIPSGFSAVYVSEAGVVDNTNRIFVAKLWTPAYSKAPIA